MDQIDFTEPMLYSLPPYFDGAREYLRGRPREYLSTAAESRDPVTDTIGGIADALDGTIKNCNKWIFYFVILICIAIVVEFTKIHREISSLRAKISPGAS